MKSAVSHAEELSASGAVMNSSRYSQASWSTSPYSHSSYENSPMNEYAHFANYIPHGIPPEPLSGVPSSVPHQHHHSQMMEVGTSMTHQQLPVLNTAWPSQLIQSSQTGGYSVSSNNMGAVPVTPSGDATRMAAEKQRRTLTFEQKKDMCLYHESNPKARQADIGAKFGVERSTVSKVLRNKEMFLKGEIDKDANGKRVTGKNPDFDRTLGIYVKKQREQGFEMSDKDIMEQARMYARGSGSQETAILNNLTPNWLQKFKQRYCMSKSEPPRRASEPNIPDNLSASTRIHSISPMSPSTQTSPLSGSRSDDDLRARGDYDFTYRQFASHSEASLTDPASSFSSELISPVGPFGFSPDAHHTGFPLDPEFERDEKRNAPFPAMEAEYAHQQHTDADFMTPRNLPSLDTSPPCKQESPVIDSVSPIPNMRRKGKKSPRGSKSNAVVSSNGVTSTAAMETLAAMPSPEDAQRAATTLLSYIQNLGQLGQFENEYSAIMQLTRKLQIQPNQYSRRSSAAGLTRIPEGEMEMITAGGDDKN